MPRRITRPLPTLRTGTRGKSPRSWAHSVPPTAGRREARANLRERVRGSRRSTWPPGPRSRDRHDPLDNPDVQEILHVGHLIVDGHSSGSGE